MALMSARPAAAAAPRRIALGRVQKIGSIASVPVTPSVKQRIARSAEVWSAALSASPEKPTREASAMCRVRSRLRSEWRDHEFELEAQRGRSP